MRPVIEKRKFELRHIVYIFIIIISLIAVGVAVYMQFFKDEELGLIFGITKEDDADYKKLKENFLNIFDNTFSDLSLNISFICLFCCLANSESILK